MQVSDQVQSQACSLSDLITDARAQAQMIAADTSLKVAGISALSYSPALRAAATTRFSPTIPLGSFSQLGAIEVTLSGTLGFVSSMPFVPCEVTVKFALVP